MYLTASIRGHKGLSIGTRRELGSGNAEQQALLRTIGRLATEFTPRPHTLTITSDSFDVHGHNLRFAPVGLLAEV